MTGISANLPDGNSSIKHQCLSCGDDLSSHEPAILRPYHAAEAITVEQAAEIAGRSPRTVRSWALLHDVGRKIAGRVILSRVALAMFLDGDRRALDLYHSGDRHSETVTSYYARLGIPVPRSMIIGTQRSSSR
jgi:hypothetical protein